MPNATLIEDNGLERVYRIADDSLITLKLEDDFTQVSFWTSAGAQLGTDEDFCFIPDEFSNRYLLSRMYVPIKGQGLGRAALQLMIDTTDAIIWARRDDGITRDDGSHLTEDAHGFVMKMQREGLIEETTSDGDYFNEFE